MANDADDFLPFALPEMGEEEIEEVAKVMRSGWVTTGPQVRQFESNFRDFLGGGVEAIAVNSATAGLHLALEAMGVGPGDEVITTTHTFTATAEVIRYLGADPVLVDIRPDTYCIDEDAVAAAMSTRTKAIIPVHFGGLAANMDALLEIAEANDAAVLEDAAHAFPATYRGQMIGALPSTASVFSFYANKTITTAEGGMLVTRRKDIADRARVMRLHGISRDVFDRYRARTPAWFYEVVAPGFKYNLTDIAAAIGIVQLRKALQFQEARERIAMSYDRAFGSLPIERPPASPVGGTHAWHLYVIRLRDDAPVDRDTFIERMHKAGVGCSVHYIPLHLQPYWRDTYSLKPSDFPVSQRLFERCVSLPIYSRMSDSDVERVVQTVAAALA